eukprot:TRINITY_DN60829_c0_g1_i1.p1 TRINITY_DN60829_c0_g1~~TRINITY_DN60829_c0_g1_i1.p1  ORF type:complete len:288 (-),score=56.48 TRINITY_DN60829_c0_g1_i1:90-953(-)
MAEFAPVGPAPASSPGSPKSTTALVAKSSPRGRHNLRGEALSAKTATRIWNDTRYNEFYERSTEERRALLDKVEGAGLSAAGVQRLQLDWQRNGVGVPPSSPQVRGRGPRGKPGPGQLARFQRAFAEVSEGHDWIAVNGVRDLLREMGLSLKATRLKDLVDDAIFCAGKCEEAKNAVPHEAPSSGHRRLSYEAALWLYSEALAPDHAEDATKRFTEDAVAMYASETDAAFEQVFPSGEYWSRPATAGTVQKDSPFLRLYKPKTLAKQDAAMMKKMGLTGRLVLTPRF